MNDYRDRLQTSSILDLKKELDWLDSAEAERQSRRLEFAWDVLTEHWGTRYTAFEVSGDLCSKGSHLELRHGTKKYCGDLLCDDMTVYKLCNALGLWKDDILPISAELNPFGDVTVQHQMTEDLAAYVPNSKFQLFYKFLKTKTRIQYDTLAPQVTSLEKVIETKEEEGLDLF